MGGTPPRSAAAPHPTAPTPHHRKSMINMYVGVLLFMLFRCLLPGPLNPKPKTRDLFFEVSDPFLGNWLFYGVSFDMMCIKHVLLWECSILESVRARIRPK